MPNVEPSWFHSCRECDNSVINTPFAPALMYESEFLMGDIMLKRAVLRDRRYNVAIVCAAFHACCWRSLSGLDLQLTRTRVNANLKDFTLTYVHLPACSASAYHVGVVNPGHG